MSMASLELIAACNNDSTCLYDSIATNSTSLGLYTAQVRGEVNGGSLALGELYDFRIVR